MASKLSQQYELLDHSVDHQHEPETEATSSKPKHSSIDLLANSSRLRTTFPARIAESIQPSRATWIWIFSSHFTVTGILIAAIVLGATKRTYAINEQASFLGVNLSLDNQMFFYGLFNKAADYVLNDSIARISGVLLTIWMTGSTRFPGVLTLDFELSEEMSKPWRAILNAGHRWKLDPPRNKSASVFRILASLASGLTVLFLGGSFNVVAMPKLRWTGRSAGTNDTSQGAHIEVPTSRINNINWSHLDTAYNVFANNGTQSTSTSLGDTAAAVSTLDVLSDLVRAINQGSIWRESDTYEGPGFVNLHTIQRGWPTQFAVDFRTPPLAVRGRGQTNANLSAEANLTTLSVQEGPIYDLWSNGNYSGYGDKALGARNWFNFTLPILSTACAGTNNETTQSVSITIPDNSSSTFAINIPGTSNVSAQSCNITTQQAIFPIYIYNSSQEARDEFNTPLSNPELFMTYLETGPQNAAIAASLANKVNITIPYLELATGIPPATILTSTAARLTRQGNSTYVGSSATAMNCVVGALVQHLITIATWEESELDQRHRVGPIQWQLYGSGPRLDWQWIIAAVLGLSVLILGYDLYLLCYRQIMPGPWLSLPGMMVAANSASSLRGLDEVDDGAWRVGELTHEVERTKYCLDEDRDGSVEISRLDVRQRKNYRGQQ